MPHPPNLHCSGVKTSCDMCVEPNIRTDSNAEAEPMETNGSGAAQCPICAMQVLGGHTEALTALLRQVLADVTQSVNLDSVEQLEQELQLLGCEEPVTVSCESWRAQEVQLQQHPALRVAMLLMLQRGLLQEQGEQGEEVPTPPVHRRLKRKNAIRIRTYHVTGDSACTCMDTAQQNN